MPEGYSSRQVLKRMTDKTRDRMERFSARHGTEHAQREGKLEEEDGSRTDVHRFGRD